MMLYGLSGLNGGETEQAKFDKAADHAAKANKLYKAGDYGKAGNEFFIAWTLVKPKVPKTLWNAAHSFEQAAVDQKASLTWRKTNAFKAKMYFTQWQALGLPNAKDATKRITGLAEFLTKVQKAIDLGQKTDDKIDLPNTVTKKAGFPVGLAIGGLVLVIGVMAMRGKKK
jgi:hypothetical protein